MSCVFLIYIFINAKNISIKFVSNNRKFTMMAHVKKAFQSSKTSKRLMIRSGFIKEALFSNGNYLKSKNTF